MRMERNEAEVSAPALWAGRTFSAIVVLFLLFDAGIKLVPIAPVTETLVQLGYSASPDLARGLGILLLICTALYVFPRTSTLGAVLLTAYLGGAVATHLRVGSPAFSHLLFGVYLGLLLWGGLYLRDLRVRSVMPWRT